MSLVGATLLTSGLVTMAFLLALRLLIKDFFSMDIVCSSFSFLTDVIPIAQGVPKSACQTAESADTRNQQLTLVGEMEGSIESAFC